MSRREIWLRFCCVLAALAAAVWIAGALGEEEPDYQTLYVMCRPKSFVNVREFPKKKAKVIGRLECGDEVLTLNEKRGKFIKIYAPTLEGGTRWVHRGYLTDEKPEVYEDGKACTVKAKGRVALRRYIKGARRAWIRPGKTLTVYAMTSEWALTNRGFIMTEYLEETDNESAGSLRREPGSVQSI
jgi:hypothetical protein